VSTLTLTRYAVHGDNTDPERPPLREVAEWMRPIASADPRIVELDGYDGQWLLLSVSEPCVDLVSQHTPAKFDRFNQLIEPGGELIGSQDLYRLPLLPGYRLVDEDTYVAAWNQVCAPEQRIPERVS
jgi:hypothetical protein